MSEQERGEEESLRLSLAADLHDGLSQYIALARMELAALHEHADAEIQERLVRIECLVELADRSLQLITLRLGALAAAPASTDQGL